MLHHLRLATLSLLLALPATAQVVLQIQAPTSRPQDSNFSIAGTYGFSVLWEDPSSIRIYATTANQRKTWFKDEIYDIKQLPPNPNPVPDPCPVHGNPMSPGWDSRCQEQIGLFWKYVDCGQGEPCERQGRWNAHPGTLNASTFPTQNLWPEKYPQVGINGFVPILTKNVANQPPICGGGLCPPPTGSPTDCHPQNPDSYSEGVANAKVVAVNYPGGQRRWFMAFNAMVKTLGEPPNSGADLFRIGWASSDDGMAWTAANSYLLRSSQESSPDCKGYGFLLTDLFIDDGNFYVLFQELETSNVYLASSLIAPYGSSPGHSEASWRVSGPISDGKRTWIPFPLGGGLLDLGRLGAVPILSDAGSGVRQTDMNRVYVPGRSGNGLTAGVDYQYILVTARGRTLQVWTANTLDDPFKFQSPVDTSTMKEGRFGWEFQMTQYPDNVDASPRLVADSLDFWVVQDLSTESPLADVMVSRRTAKLTGGIFGP